MTLFVKGDLPLFFEVALYSFLLIMVWDFVGAYMELFREIIPWFMEETS
jgi:hypothetical protein